MTEPACWTIREFRDGDEHGILRLFNGVFAIGNSDFEPRTLTHWNWAFRDNPEGHHTFVAEVDEQIVGLYTAIPARWRYPDRVALGAQAVDSCVADAYRRSLKKSGLFLTLGREWFDHHAHDDLDRIVYGFPNPQAFRIGTKRLDYRPIHCPVPESSLAVTAAAGFEAPGLHVETIDAFGHEVDHLDEALAPRLGIAAVRDARYLNWRYTRCPITSYRLLRAESAAGDPRGFLVHGLGWHGDRKDIAPVVDWLIEPGDQPTWRALLGAAARSAHAAGLRDLLTWVPRNHPHARDLAQLGFQTADSRFNLCIRIFNPVMDVERAKREWYVLMGDSDIY